MNKRITKKTLATLLTCFIVGSSWAQTTFSSTGSIQTYTVPAGVTLISIDAYGAQGGNTNGGLGAQIYGEFAVTPGQVLNVLVGEQGVVNNCGGSNASGGGGGGSFIWDPTNMAFPLIASAGGGGGNTNWGGIDVDGVDGQGAQAGTASAGGATLAGIIGEGGLGNGASGAGAGGAGWNSNGENSTYSSPALGGESLPNFAGGAGSPDFGPGGEGGFGGGGGATCGCGGGAGYSGGSGGEGASTREGGGGGGSYNAGSNVANTTGVRSGNGEITISPIVILTTSIIVQGQGGASTITTMSGTLQMEAAVLPINATDGTYTWSVVNGTGAASINATGLLTASADGTVTVTATANDASGVTGSAIITITNQTAGLIEDNLNLLLTMYPNPSNGIVYFKTDETIQGVEVFNTSGQQVMAFKASNQINISNLENGVYFIKVILNGNQTVVKRLVKS